MRLTHNEGDESRTPRSCEGRQESGAGFFQTRSRPNGKRPSQNSGRLKAKGPLEYEDHRMKVRLYPDTLIVFLVLLAALCLVAEGCQAPPPNSLVRFLLAHHLWHLWIELRWNWMYSHEILHFISGVFGAMLGCWLYFAVQKRKSS
jgi:hypothetical protein